jgi:hypothetical protein
MNLTHVIWSYDSSDWKVASGQATEQEVQNNYNSLIQLATNGSFNKVRLSVRKMRMLTFAVFCRGVPSCYSMS